MSRHAIAPDCTTFEAPTKKKARRARTYNRTKPARSTLESPLKTVHMMRLKSAATEEPSAQTSSFGTTVQPSRTPVKPAYFEKEFTSIAHVRAPNEAREEQPQ